MNIFLKFFTLLIILLLFQGSAFAEVKVSESHAGNLEDFEAWRTETCIKTQRDWEKSSKNVKNRKVEALASYLEAYCAMDTSVVYLAPAAEAACRKDKRTVTEICRQLAAYRAIPESPAQHYFAEDFLDLMLITKVEPWELLTLENGIARRAGVAQVKRGNVYLEATAELIALDINEYTPDEMAAYTGYLEGLGLNLARGDILYVPFLKLHLNAQGLTGKTVPLEIELVHQDGRVLNLAGEEERIGGEAAFNYFLPLTRQNIDLVGAAMAIRITGFEGKKKQTPLYQLTIESAGFARVMNQLLAHYRTLPGGGE